MKAILQRYAPLMGLAAFALVMLVLSGCCHGYGHGKCSGKACEAKGMPAREGAVAVVHGDVATVNTAGLKALLAAKAPLAILDARSGKYDDGRRIPGAKSLHAMSSEEEIKALLPDKGGLVITYCGGLKCPASNQLAERLGKLGYENVVEYPEGIAGWAEAGNPIEQVTK